MAQGFRPRKGNFGPTLPMPQPSPGQPLPMFSDGAQRPMPSPQATPFPPPPLPAQPTGQPPAANNSSASSQNSWVSRNFGKAAREAAGKKVRTMAVATIKHPWGIPLVVGAVAATVVLMTGSYNHNSTAGAIAEIGLTGVGMTTLTRGFIYAFRPPTLLKMTIAVVAAAGIAWGLPDAAPQLVHHGMSPRDPYAQMVQKIGNMVRTPTQPVVPHAGDILTVNPGQTLTGVPNQFDEHNRPTDPNRLVYRSFPPGTKFLFIGERQYGNTTVKGLKLIDNNNNPIVDPQTGKTIFYSNSPAFDYTITPMPSAPGPSSAETPRGTPIAPV